MKYLIIIILLICLISCNRTNTCNDNELNAFEEGWVNYFGYYNIKFKSNLEDTINCSVHGEKEAEYHSTEENCGSDKTLIGYNCDYSFSGFRINFNIHHSTKPQLFFSSQNGQSNTQEIDVYNKTSVTINNFIYNDVYKINFEIPANDTLLPKSVAYSIRSGLISWTTSTSKTYNLLR